MADTDVYPQGQVSFAGGELRQCTDCSFDYGNGAKAMATLRRRYAGVVVGAQSVSIRGSTIVDGGGPERDWFQKVNEATPEQAHFKFPGGVEFLVNCVVARITGELKTGEAVALNFELVGGYEKTG